MKARRRLIAVVRRDVRRLAAIAAERAAEAERIRPPPSFRALSAAEAEALVGAEILAALGGERWRA